MSYIAKLELACEPVNENQKFLSIQIFCLIAAFTPAILSVRYCRESMTHYHPYESCLIARPFIKM